MLQCINGASSNSVGGTTKIRQLKDLILTLFGVIFRCIYTCVCRYCCNTRFYIRFTFISIYLLFAGDCYNNGQSQQYTGTQSTTVGGRTCQRWNTDYPHQRNQKCIPTTYSDRNSNYCRDENNYGIPWCYTTDPDVRWEACPVPAC